MAVTQAVAVRLGTLIRADYAYYDGYYTEKISYYYFDDVQGNRPVGKTSSQLFPTLKCWDGSALQTYRVAGNKEPNTLNRYCRYAEVGAAVRLDYPAGFSDETRVSAGNGYIDIGAGAYLTRGGYFDFTDTAKWGAGYTVSALLSFDPMDPAMGMDDASGFGSYRCTLLHTGLFHMAIDRGLSSRTGSAGLHNFLFRGKEFSRDFTVQSWTPLVSMKTAGDCAVNLTFAMDFNGTLANDGTNVTATVLPYVYYNCLDVSGVAYPESSSGKASQAMKAPVAAQSLSFGESGAMKLYALRVYNRPLTADELRQNAFADFVSYHGINLTRYRLLDAEKQKAVAAAVAEYSITDYARGSAEAQAAFDMVLRRVDWPDLYAASENLVYSWDFFRLTAGAIDAGVGSGVTLGDSPAFTVVKGNLASSSVYQYQIPEAASLNVNPKLEYTLLSEGSYNTDKDGNTVNVLADASGNPVRTAADTESKAGQYVEATYDGGTLVTAGTYYDAKGNVVAATQAVPIRLVRVTVLEYTYEDTTYSVSRTDYYVDAWAGVEAMAYTYYASAEATELTSVPIGQAQNVKSTNSRLTKSYGKIISKVAYPDGYGRELSAVSGDGYLRLGSGMALNIAGLFDLTAAGSAPGSYLWQNGYSLNGLMSFDGISSDMARDYGGSRGNYRGKFIETSMCSMQIDRDLRDGFGTAGIANSLLRNSISANNEYSWAGPHLKAMNADQQFDFTFNDTFREFSVDGSSATFKQTVSMFIGAQKDREFSMNTANTLSAPSAFKIGDAAMKLYSLRIYNRALTASEIAQNHFADLVKYYMLDAEAFVALDLSDAQKQELYTAFLDLDIVPGAEGAAAARSLFDEKLNALRIDRLGGSDTSSDVYHLAALLRAGNASSDVLALLEALTPAQLAGVAAEYKTADAIAFDQLTEVLTVGEALSFDGYQVYLKNAPQLRARWTVNTDKLAALEALGYTLKISVEGTDVAASEVYATGAAENGIFLDTDELRHIGLTFTYADTSDEKAAYQAKKTAAAQITVSRGATVVMSAVSDQTQSANYPTGASIYDISARLLKTYGYNSPMITEVVSLVEHVGADMSLGGYGIYRFEIVSADSSTDAAAELLAAQIKDMSGYQLHIVTEATGDYAIVLRNDLDGYNTYKISMEGKTATFAGAGGMGALYAVYGAREQMQQSGGNFTLNPDNTVHSVTATIDSVTGVSGTTIQAMVSADFFEGAEQTYALDRLLRADGTINSDLTGDLNIVFIGGSLTQGGTDNWEKMICDYYRQKYPQATVNATNAGVGGTGSADGATRYAKDVLAYNPDVVFIEFAINDNGRNEMDAKVYLEAMIRQSTAAAKIPVIMGLYCPFGGDKDTSTYTSWSKQVQWKQEVHDYYGIPTVNIYDYYWAQYEAYRADGHANVSYVDFLGGQNQDGTAYYHTWDASSRTYNVHCKTEGYNMYGRAVLEAFNANGGQGFTDMMLSNCLARMDYYCEGEDAATIIGYRYCFTGASSDRFTYNNSASCSWYDFTGNIQSGDVDPGKNLMQYFPDGVKAVERSSSDAGEEVSFVFTTSAQAVAFKYPASLWGLNADVYVDGVKKGSIKVQSVYSAAYTTNFVDTGITDGAEHTVCVVVSDFITGERNDRDGAPATSDINIFRFGYLIERTGN